MPGVSGSSSRDVTTAKSAAGFDLQTQSGIANLLKQLRTSGLSPQTKTTIRELVLRYAQTGGDIAVRQELETILSSLSLIPGSISVAKAKDKTKEIKEEASSLKLESEPKKSFGFSGGRPVPSFFKPNTVEVKATPNPTTAPVNTEALQSTSTKISNPSEDVSPPAEKVKEPSVTIDSTPTSKLVTGGKSHLDRILEIKREVIKLVGNPVNLVDIDNAVGKQYMTALLEAMKKTNGGTKEEAAQAMINLEKAFVAVKGVAERGMKPEFEPLPDQVPIMQSQPTTASVAEETPPEAETKDTIPTEVSPSEPIPMPPPPPGIKENLVQDEEAWKKIATEQSLESTDNKVSSLNQKDGLKVERKLGGVPLQDIPTYGFSKPTRDVVLPDSPKPTTPETPNPGHIIQPPPVPNFIPKDRNKAPLAQPTDTGEDLMTPDITVGLTQLLSEWKIFKGSGLFGMGPGGIDHPLYVNIKDSSMLSIMNGTFNGATGEIQQSINDYINGWRYEQSIVPQHSETFEHFLRRVVRKVLKDAKR